MRGRGILTITQGCLSACSAVYLFSGSTVSSCAIKCFAGRRRSDEYLLYNLLSSFLFSFFLLSSFGLPESDISVQYGSGKL